MKIIESRHNKLLQFRIVQVVALSHFYSFGGRGKKSKVTFSGKTHQTIFIHSKLKYRRFHRTISIEGCSPCVTAING